MASRSLVPVPTPRCSGQLNSNVSPHSISDGKREKHTLNRVLKKSLVHVVVRPKTIIKFSFLELDSSKFHPIVNPENANNVAYSNSDAGLMYVISKRDDLVLYVQYGPTLKDCEAALK